MKRYATIDIGTNSMRLLLAEVDGQQILHRQKHLNTTRIGKSVDQDGRITSEGLQTNLKAYVDFVNQAKQWGAEDIWAIATSAVRDAENGQEFADEAHHATGVKIEIIDGKQEAILGYQGVLMGLKEPLPQVFLIDIGGGSTELIIGDDKRIIEANSYNIGAVRMTERWITTDPPVDNEINDLVEEITRILEEPLKSYPSNLEHIIGIGGTATTIAALHQALVPYDPDKVHGYKLGLQEIADLRGKIKLLSNAERRQLKGLEPKRADIIVAGITIMITAMELLKIPELMISEYDNLEGLLWSKVNGRKV
ncbi:Ppx/GppA phosphatase family protein [Alkaliphilus hydrothermalis]|uniref:Exopolyphosphatase/guanosine-5'-triphosphate, 3'-diphosphate pyrophosphatase n=1 Tax=Alkaliphilus hydrothermalis TaxID=1482730 RepID=A0ABS2NPB9_9FIRM|nr:Ppx/GppA phosphatase family protein [Alkaliphilus hydrothermalis]MBM7614793.1 exopolyphosphatase/guanosine-5'-triphosphate,3'-diphosphate pyrophosphatase [Alkaliphilus hydrothermalis]